MIYVLWIVGVCAVLLVAATTLVYLAEHKHGYLNNFYPLAIVTALALVVLFVLAVIHWL